MFNDPLYVAGGGFASYGGARSAMGRQAALLADKLMKGAFAGELPVETVWRLELVVNLVAARKLGVEVPAIALFKADQIIR